MKNIKKYLLVSILLGVTTIASGQWQQVGLDIDGEASGDLAGSAVAVSSDGSVIAVSSPLNFGVNGINSGHVRIFENNNGTWNQVGQNIDGEAEDDHSGSSVSLNSDGSIVAIGAIWNDGADDKAGHVRVYENVAGSWLQIGDDINGEAANDESGNAIDLSHDGTILAIGANQNDGNGTDSGHVSVYENIAGTWQQIGSDIDGEAQGDSSGKSVSLSHDGSFIAIGAQLNAGAGAGAGHVRVFENIAGEWIQVGADIDGESPGDVSGRAVSLNWDGSIVAIGASGNNGSDPGAGHVRVYEFVGASWQQIGLDIDGESEFDRSGHAVSLNADGSVVAIGAYSNAGNGSNAGHVRVYQNNGGSWEQVYEDIDGEAENDYSGRSVALSENGGILVIGAYLNDGNGSNSGHARVFQNPILSRGDFSETNISVHPNPSSGEFYIENAEGFTLKIRDLNGRLLYNHEIIGNNYHVDNMRFIQRGVYLMTLNSGTINLTMKHIVD